MSDKKVQSKANVRSVLEKPEQVSKSTRESQADSAARPIQAGPRAAPGRKPLFRN